MMHDFDLEHEHDDEMSEADREAIARAIWEQDTVELRTVGIDIGSSTSHLLFARVTLKRQAEGLSSRFVVVDRQIIWRSPIMLTPFLADGTIDAKALEHFVHHAYHDAGLHPSDIDSGAVILTGEAIKRKNARAIDEIFAEEVRKIRLRHRRAQARKHPGGARLRCVRTVAAARRLRAACRYRRRHDQARADRQRRDRERRRFCRRRTADRTGCRWRMDPRRPFRATRGQGAWVSPTTPDRLADGAVRSRDRQAPGDFGRRSDRRRAA